MAYTNPNIQDANFWGRQTGIALKDMTPAELSAMAKHVLAMQSGTDRIEIKTNQDGALTSQVVAYQSDFVDYLKATQVQQAITDALASVEGGMRLVGIFNPITESELPTTGSGVNGALRNGDVWIIHEVEGTINFPGTSVYEGKQDVFGGTLTLTQGDQLIYRGVDERNNPIWAHSDDAFYNQLATSVAKGIVQLAALADVNADSPIDGIEDRVLTYAGWKAGKTLIESGYISAIQAQELTAAADRVAKSRQFGEAMATLIDGFTVDGQTVSITDVANKTFTQIAQAWKTALDHLKTLAESNRATLGQHATDIDNSVKKTGAAQTVETDIQIGGVANIGVLNAGINATDTFIELDTQTLQSETTITFSGFHSSVEFINGTHSYTIDPSGNGVRIPVTDGNVRALATIDETQPIGYYQRVDNNSLKVTGPSAFEGGISTLAQDLDGNEVNNAPSVSTVRAANAALDNKIETNKETIYWIEQKNLEQDNLLGTKANDDQVVKLSGTQSIGGNKSFDGTTSLNDVAVSGSLDAQDDINVTGVVRLNSAPAADNHAVRKIDLDTVANEIAGKAHEIVFTGAGTLDGDRYVYTSTMPTGYKAGSIMSMELDGGNWNSQYEKSNNDTTFSVKTAFDLVGKTLKVFVSLLKV